MFIELSNNKSLLFFLCCFLVLLSFQGCGDPNKMIEESLDDKKVETSTPLTLSDTSLKITMTPELEYEDTVTAKVINVVSGNRIEVLVHGELKKVMYLGVDIPNDAIIQNKALMFNKFLVEGKQANIEFDRIIPISGEEGYVYVDGVFINAAIIEKGLGRVSELPIGNSESSDLNIAQEMAQKNMVGIWAEINTESDKKVDSTNRVIPVFEGGTLPKLGKQEIGQECDFSNSPLKVIKGKYGVSSSQGIFYTPDMDGYDSVDVVRAEGDKWFCTLEEAVKQGWLIAVDK